MIWLKAEFGRRKAEGIQKILTGTLLLLGLLSSALRLPPSAFAAFEDTGTGARGTALGSNYAVMGDDVLSLMYNPAALARVEQKEITTEYSKLYTGLSDGSNLSQYYLGYGQPISWGGTLAAGIKQFSLDGLYKERTLSLGYGEWLTSKIAVGGAVKQLYHSFGVPTMIVDDNGNIQSGTPTFFAENGNSNTAYSADLGMLYRWTDRHTIGLSIQDVNEPNIALNPADHEIVPRTIRAAFAYAADRRLTLAAGVTRRQSLASQTDTTWTGSAEKWWNLVDGDEVALRGSLASGSRQFQQGAFGAGYRLHSFEIDYTFVFNLTGITPGATLGTHRFSLTYRFGPKGIPVKAKAPPKARATKTLPEGYEHADKAQPKPKPAFGTEAIPVPTAAPAPVRALPREVEIQITPEDIEGNYIPAPLTVEDISVSVVFDSDYDGLPDEEDRCPNTPFGLEVDAKGCSTGQLDHHGAPLPKKVQIEFLPVEEGGK